MTNQLDFHALLILGANADGRYRTALDEAQKREGDSQNNQDRLILQAESKSIGIEEIRKLRQWSYLKPSIGHFKTAIVQEAQLMSLEAQNALLKTLEEPPAQTLIILTAPQRGSLLPTVVSRCFIKELPTPKRQALSDQEVSRSGINSIEHLLSRRRSQLLQLFENETELFSDREKLLDTLDEWIEQLRSILLSDPQKIRRSLIITNRLIEARDKIAKTNLNPRLWLETTFLNLLPPETY